MLTIAGVLCLLKSSEVSLSQSLTGLAFSSSFPGTNEAMDKKPISRVIAEAILKRAFDLAGVRVNTKKLGRHDFGDGGALISR